MKRPHIQIGPAGSGGLGNLEGVKKAHELGFDAMEVEFTYGVQISNNDAKAIGKLAKALNILLSVHCPYYVNLASFEPCKIVQSKKRILLSSERAHYLGARYVVFHAGFYQSRSEGETYMMVKKEIKDMLRTIKKKKWDIALAPETTGKKSQFGSLDELLRLAGETGCELCVDFAHILGREGRINYRNVFKKLKNIKHIHAHFSGIEYTKKGERRHLVTGTKELKLLLGYVVKSKVDITIINESPDPIGDCLKTKDILNSLCKKSSFRI